MPVYPDCCLLSLVTVGLFRKYISFLELPISCLLPARLCCCVGLQGYRQAKVSVQTDCLKAEISCPTWYNYIVSLPTYSNNDMLSILNTFKPKNTSHRKSPLCFRMPCFAIALNSCGSVMPTSSSHDTCSWTHSRLYHKDQRTWRSIKRMFNEDNGM